MRTLLLVGVLAACAPTPDALHPDQCPDVNEDLTELKDADLVGMPIVIEQSIQATMGGRFPGCAVAIADAGEVVFAKGYGAADLGADLANPADDVAWDLRTTSNLGSVSKMLTAVAVLRLDEMNVINIDLPLSTWLSPNVPGWDDVTVRQVLQHRAGFVRDPDASDPAALDAADIDATFAEPRASQHPRYAIWELLLTAAAEPEQAMIGRYRYSNVGYTLLGALIDEVTRQPGFPGARGYEPFVWSVVTDAPDGTLTACLDHDWRAGQMPDHAVSYTPNGGAVIDVAYSGWQGPAGGWSMTIADLARFAANLEAGHIVSAATLAEMRALPPGWVAGEERYGLGVFLDPINNLPAYGHGGVIEGYRAQVYVWPDSDLAVAVQCNADTTGVGLIASEAGRLYMAGNLTAMAISPEERQRMQTATWEVSTDHVDALQPVVVRSIGALGQRRFLGALHSQLLAHPGYGPRFLTAVRLGDVELASEVMLAGIAADGRLGPYWP